MDTGLRFVCVCMILMWCADTSLCQGVQTSSFVDPSPSHPWVAPPPLDENSRLLKISLNANFQRDGDLPGLAYSTFDLSAKRKLDEHAVIAEGSIRFRKDLSSSDSASDLDLRLARISYLDPLFQATVGRFEVFQMVSPNLFFGAYPLMGIHRADGLFVTIPFSFLFNFGNPKGEEKLHSSPPLALGFFYTPSLFSAQQVEHDLTQAFWLSQVRFRLEGDDLGFNVRANAGQSGSNFFEYSSFSGDWTGSLAAELAYHGNYSLSAEYGVQSFGHPRETSALAVGFQANRIGTWGAFSFEQIAVEGQFPVASSTQNAFAGGNAFVPTIAQSPQAGFYFKAKARLRILFIEFHATNNQNDYTLGRPTQAALGVPFTGRFGPGNEADGPGSSLRSSSYEDIAFLLRTGVEF